MDPLDGNAIAGPLFEYFGSEMTTATGCCRHCGARTLIAELQVYSRAPGAVARCRTCGDVVMVLVKIHGSMRVNIEEFEMSAAS